MYSKDIKARKQPLIVQEGGSAVDRNDSQRKEKARCNHPNMN